MKTAPSTKQLRYKSFTIWISVLFLIIVSIVLFFTGGSSALVISAILLFAFAWIYRNERTVYDDMGITVCTMGRKFFISWDDVISVEFTKQYTILTPLTNIPERIVKIAYVGNKGQTECLRYDCMTISGLEDLLTYYRCTIQKADL